MATAWAVYGFGSSQSAHHCPYSFLTGEGCSCLHCAVGETEALHPRLTPSSAQDSHRQTGYLCPQGSGSLELSHSLTDTLDPGSSHHSVSGWPPPSYSSPSLPVSRIYPCLDDAHSPQGTQNPAMHPGHAVSYTSQDRPQTEARLRERSWGVWVRPGARSWGV